MVMTMTLKYSPEIEALINRLRNGNAKIWEVYNSALSINLETDKEKFDAEMDRVTKAVRKLDLLRLEAEAKGVTECLYEMPICTQKTLWCWGCPAKNTPEIIKE